MGCYYQSLTSVCALGERVLNHLVLALRDEYSGTAEFRKVRGKESSDNRMSRSTRWRPEELCSPKPAEQFRKLRSVRHRSPHFDPETDRDVRAPALDAVQLFQGIIQTQFAALGAQPWYIPNNIGFSLVRKAWEGVPFVRHVVLPTCAEVGPAHDLRGAGDGRWEVIDEGT